MNVTGPLDVVLIGLPVKIAMSMALWVMVQYTRSAYSSLTEDGEGGPSYLYFISLVLVMLVNEIAGTLMFVSLMSFFSKISDPSIGGSYMTLLNTLANLGGKWPSALALWLLPKMTFHVCDTKSQGGYFRQTLPFPCTLQESSVCTEHDGTCEVDMVCIDIF